MRKKSITRIIFFITILFILLYIYPKNVHRVYVYTDSRSYNSDDFVDIGFSLFQFEQAKYREIQLEYEYDLTAILLHWQRLEGIQKTVKFLLNSRLFKEIIIWNNNPQINLTLHHLINTSHETRLIRIINSKENLKDVAKYLACSEATTRACFYVDDDWDITHYLKSLISSFRSDPHVLHSVTDSYTFYTNLMWSYFDSTIDLHSGFSWIGCGSVFLRRHAQRHLQLLKKFLVNDSALIQLSDVFFSIWLNDIPTQMNTNIQEQSSVSPNGSLSFSSTSNFSDLQHRSSVFAIRILEHCLKNADNITFPRQQNRRFPSYVKSPSLNDGFIFYTNVLPFEMQNISFNISRDFERGTRQNLPRGPNVTFFTSHSTWKAVDGNVSTCWQTNRPIHSGDFFAIDLLRIQTNITFVLTVQHSPLLQQNLEIGISLDGVQWIPYRSLKGNFTTKNEISPKKFYVIIIDSSQFSRGFQYFRYISFKSINSSNQYFRICEIELISKTSNI